MFPAMFPTGLAMLPTGLTMVAAMLPTMLTVFDKMFKPQWTPQQCYCQLCDMQEKEDTKHFLVRCPFFVEHRKRLLVEFAGRLETDSDCMVQLYGRVVMERIQQLSLDEVRLVMLDGIHGLDISYPVCESHTLNNDSSKQSQKDRTLAIHSVHSKVERTINNYVWICWKARERHMKRSNGENIQNA
jgi:hypothetical protein